MAGPLVEVDTTIRAIDLDVQRGLYMGENVTLRLCIPDENSIGGLGIIREYTEAFNRVTPAEKEIGDGVTVVVDLADIFPQGQIAADIEAAKFLQFVIEGEEGLLYEINKTPAPAQNETQVWRITCATATFKKTYFRTGK